jgi:hypothetical protein
MAENTIVRALPTALLVAGALLAAGCGSSGSSTTSSTTVPAGRVGNTTAPPCSQGCDVPVGSYEGKNDQGKALRIHVSVGHLTSGPHIVATGHFIDHFKTEFLVDCGSQGKANNKVDTTTRGYINGVIGHLRYGANYMQVFWTPGEPITAVAESKSRDCSGKTVAKLTRTGA